MCVYVSVSVSVRRREQEVQSPMAPQKPSCDIVGCKCVCGWVGVSGGVDEKADTLPPCSVCVSLSYIQTHN